MSLRTRFNADSPLILPGVYDGLSAQVATQQGADAVYVSGSSVAASIGALPDVGLLTMSELLDRIRAIAGTVDVPVVADADTGYGNALNVRRTVREYERAGVSAIQLEDQRFPKKCGHFDGKAVIEPEEFVRKIAAATDARRNDETLIIARTDAIATESVEEATDRANMYRDAGADVLFVEAPRTRDEMERVIEAVPGTHIANLTYGGETPLVPPTELGKIGYDAVLYPATAVKGAIHTFETVYETVLSGDGIDPIVDTLAGWEKRNAVTGLDEIYDLENRYGLE